MSQSAPCFLNMHISPCYCISVNWICLGLGLLISVTISFKMSHLAMWTCEQDLIFNMFWHVFRLYVILVLCPFSRSPCSSHHSSGPGQCCWCWGKQLHQWTCDGLYSVTQLCNPSCKWSQTFLQNKIYEI